MQADPGPCWAGFLCNWASLLMTSEGVGEATSTGGSRTRAHIYWGNRAFRFGTWKKLECMNQNMAL